MAKDDSHKGYAARFNKGGDTLRKTDTVHPCPECGKPMAISREWRGGGEDRTLFHISGICENGHTLERYGYGEAVS